MTVHVKQLLIKGTLQRAPSESMSTSTQGISAEDLEVWRHDIMNEVRQLIGEKLREQSER
jgi:hypothetical protein